MSIIYSYPEETSLQGSDMLIGTSTALVGGKQKNITKNFTLDQLSSYLSGGSGIINPVATDFQIAVFNQSGTRLTGSIMSQDTSPSNGAQGSLITISGGLTATGNLIASGTVTLGSGSNLIDLTSTTKFSGPVQDSSGLSGTINQILLSNVNGELVWGNYTAGLTYAGLWDAATNDPGLSSGNGVSSTFYIVGVAGNIILDGNTNWQVGDWAIFIGTTGQGGVWQKIDNTSSITGSGTIDSIPLWSNTFQVTDSIISQDAGATAITVAGALTSTGNISGVNITGTGNISGVDITGTGNLSGTDLLLTGKISLSTDYGTAGQTLSSGGAGSPAAWITPTVGTVTGSGSTNNIPLFTDGATGVLGDSILSQLNAAGSFTSNYLSVGGSGVSTQGLEINGFLLDNNGSKGSNTQILISTGNGVQWIDNSGGEIVYSLITEAKVVDSIPLKLNAVGGTSTTVTLTGGTNVTLDRTTATEITINSTDTNTNTTYALAAGTKASSSVPLNLDATGGSNSTVNFTEGTGITIDRTSATEITISGSAQGVTSVTGDTTTIASTGGFTPTISAITTGGVGVGLNNLATGGQIQSAIDTAITGQLVFAGNYDATTAPPSGASVLQGYTYVVTVAGDYSGFWPIPLAIGDLIIANVVNPTSISDWTEVNKQADIASATTLGIANFPTGNNGLNVSAGAVTAKLFTGTTPGYVPDATSADTGTFLRKDGTWAVAGAGTVTGTGTQYKIPLWSGTSSITDSLLTQDASSTKVTIDGLVEVLGDGSAQDGRIKLNCWNNNHGVTIQSPPHSAAQSWTWILPQTTGSANDVLTTNGATPSQLSWSPPTTGTVTSVSAGTGLTGGTITSTGSISLSNVGTAGTYTSPSSVVVDAQGRITSITSGAAALPTKTVDTFTGSGQTFIDLTVEASSVNYIDMFIDGVYQAKATYTITTVGVITRVTLAASAVFPTGVSIETVTTT